jgi:hypothetical protein
MQILLETNFLFTAICHKNPIAYAGVLDQILFSRSVNISLKAAICRQIITAASLAADPEDERNDGEEVGNNEGGGGGKFGFFTQSFVKLLLPSLVQIIRASECVFLQSLSMTALVRD